MNVYIVESFFSQYDDKYQRIEGVFRNKEDADNLVKEIEKQYQATDEEEALYYKLIDIYDDCECELDPFDWFASQSEFDKREAEVEKLFKEKSGYTAEFLNELANKFYAEFQFCRVTEEELL